MTTDNDYHLLVSTKAQLGFSMPLFLPSFPFSPTITVGLSSRPSSSLARLYFDVTKTQDYPFSTAQPQLVMSYNFNNTSAK